MAKNIPRAQWKQFCDQFTRQHEGWLVTVTDVSDQKTRPNASGTAQASTHVVARDLRLKRITAEREGNDLELRIVAGDGSKRVTHFVLDPARIQLEQTRYGTDWGLRLDAKDDRTTLMRFQVPMLS